METKQIIKQIKVVHLEKEKNIIFSEYSAPIEDTSIKNLKDLYLYGIKEYGRCISKMYVDDKHGEAKHIGYVFEKKAKYEDVDETFTQETWLSLEHYEKRTIIKYLPIDSLT